MQPFVTRKKYKVERDNLGASAFRDAGRTTAADNHLRL